MKKKKKRNNKRKKHQLKKSRNKKPRIKKNLKVKKKNENRYAKEDFSYNDDYFFEDDYNSNSRLSFYDQLIANLKVDKDANFKNLESESSYYGAELDPAYLYENDFLPDFYDEDDFITNYDPITGRIRYSYDDLLEDMEIYANVDGKKVPPVYVQRDYVGYDLKKNQLDYYFYWRTQAREGNYILTDLYYFQLYFVELLNMIGCSSPKEALQKLNTLFLKMLDPRAPFKLTDSGKRIFANNIFDFIYYHKLDLNSVNSHIWEYIDDNNRFIAFLDKQNSSGNLILPFKIIDILSGFDISEKSKIFNNNPEIYKEALTNVFYVINFLEKKEGKPSFINSSYYYFEKIRPLIFDTFENAPIDYSKLAIDVRPTTRINEFSLQLELSKIIQEVENVFRDFFGQRGRLRKYKVDEWTRSIIRDFLESEYQLGSGYKYTGTIKPALDYIESLTKEKEIKIDFEKIETLRNETEIVQELMDTSENEENLDDIENSLIFVEPLSRVLSNLSKVEPSIIKIISQVIDSGENNLKNNELFNYNNLIDIEAKRYLNHEFLIKTKKGYKINEEYYPSLHFIFEHRDEYPFLNISEEPNLTENEEMVNFVNDLNNTEKEFIKILLNNNSSDIELNELAMSEMTMVEIIFDDINNKALLYLDDIVLEMDEDNSPIIIEEHFKVLKNLLEVGNSL